ncbi:SCP-like protein [Ancylostoma duodenale]|uniref:SCP-like protein n=1 Tax=Ancylostoma duodenale TaxID=51022 RepID=A0A0C2CGE9_9BILA|nr:SCP-like protein [Ancylostoma duodenale]
MAFATTDGFACSYRRCGGKFFLVCFYNKAPAVGNELYGAPKVADQYCDNCEKYPANTGNPVGCEAYLCQYPLTPAEVKLKVCDTCVGKFSDEFRLTALDMHNYYRRLVATGWAKNGDKYAKTAAKMVELKYDKTLENKAIANADKCPNAAKGGPGGENFWGLQGGYNMPHIEAFKKAMKYWWDPFEKSGFGDELSFTDTIQGGNLKYAANILHEGTTNIGCAVNSCPDSGRIVIDCVYNRERQP